MKSFDLVKILDLPDLPRYLELVEVEMNQAVTSDSPPLSKPIKRLLSAPGKRLRPSLVIAVAGKINDKVIKVAAAIELIHIASLVHDDIIDEASLRHNIATVNSSEGNNMAIIVGDFLLSRACVLAATVSTEAAELIASTFAKLCEGQAREMADDFNLDRQIDDYFKSIKGKTAALFAASCRMGALVAALPANEVKAYTDFGHNFGIAYQVIDDILDFTSTEEKSGKPVGNDVHEGVYTLPLLLALRKSRPIYEKLIKAGNGQKLSTKLQSDDFIKEALAEAQKYNKLAENNIKTLNKNTSSFAAKYFESI